MRRAVSCLGGSLLGCAAVYATRCRTPPATIGAHADLSCSSSSGSSAITNAWGRRPVAAPAYGAADASASPAALRLARRWQSQSSRGLPSLQFQDGVVDPRFSSEHHTRKLNPDTMAHYVKATIQNDRREMGLGEVVDWGDFAKDAIYIPTRSGPLWVGSDDPRAAKFMRRKEKLKRSPLQRSRPKPGPDPAKMLQNHPLREYFTTTTNLNDPLSVANNLHRAGIIREFDIKHTAAKIQYRPRPPIVSIMGHVDHGKTTLLDYLRHTNVASGEAGGITQNVGAFTVTVPGTHGDAGADRDGGHPKSSEGSSSSSSRKAPVGEERRVITFIDTPGHAAFTTMREVGAAANDMIILVVSAADGVQPQTVEVIDLAKRFGLPMVVAITKIDRQPNCDYVKSQLRDHGVELEEDGGDVQVVKVCARDGTGIPDLLEALQLQAELCEISTPTPSRAELTVIESTRTDAHEVSAVVRCGNVRPGQVFVAGMVYAVVKKVMDEHGNMLAEAGPSVPVSLRGFRVPPKPGSVLLQVSSEQHAEKFYQFMREVFKTEGSRENYLQLMNQEQQGNFWDRKPDNNLVRQYSTRPFLITCKAATFGMLQALMRMIYELPRLEGLSMEVKNTDVGGLQDHDLMVLGGPGQPACVLLYGDCRDNYSLDIPNHVRVIRFTVLYHGIEELKQTFVDQLPKTQRTRVLATADCLQTFKASQAGRTGNAGGMKVTKGTLEAAHPLCRVMRKKRKLTAAAAVAASSAEDAAPREIVYEGQMKELRRFKDLVPTVETGLECGVILHDEFAFKPGDVLELYEEYEEELDVAEVYEAAEKRERALRATAEAQAALEDQQREREQKESATAELEKKLKAMSA